MSLILLSEYNLVGIRFIGVRIDQILSTLATPKL